MESSSCHPLGAYKGVPVPFSPWLEVWMAVALQTWGCTPDTCVSGDTPEKASASQRWREEGGKSSCGGAHLPALLTFPLCHRLPLNRVTVLPTQAKTLSPARWTLLYILSGQFRSRTFLDQRNVNKLFTHLWSELKTAVVPVPAQMPKGDDLSFPSSLPTSFLTHCLQNSTHKPPSPKKPTSQLGHVPSRGAKELKRN